MVAAQFFSLAMILVVCPRRIGPDWKRQLGMRRPSAFHVVLILMVIPGFMITADAIQTLFVWATGLKPPFAVRALNGIFGKFPWPLTAIAVALGPGIVEELWCRGFLGRGLSARYGLGLGVFITSMLFAGMHLDPSQFLVIAAMGAYLHFTYLATRSIWVPILLHASNNGLAIVLALAIKPAENEIKVIPIIVYLVALGLVVFASVALWTSRAVLLPVRSAGAKEERDEWAPSWHPEYPGISAPPAGSGLVVGAEPVSPVAVIFTFACFGILLYLTYRFVL
jgi:membrane protease YdiL (CAAX protease family)